MIQLGLMFDAAGGPPPTIESRENDNGVLIDCRTMELLGKERGRRYGGGRPKLAEIRVAYAAGEWHWGISITTSSLGIGFAPAKKWRHSASSYREAVDDAAAFILDRIDSSTSVSGWELDKIRTWVRRVLSGEAMPS